MLVISVVFILRLTSKHNYKTVSLLFNIFHFLDMKTLCLCSQLSVQLNSIAFDERIWKLQFIDTWTVKNSINCSMNDPPIHPLSWRESCKAFHEVLLGKESKVIQSSYFLLRKIANMSNVLLCDQLFNHNFPSYIRYQTSDKLNLPYPTVFINYERSATPILYCFDHISCKWYWSPDMMNYMESSSTTVTGGIWVGEKPVPGNIRTINSLQQLNPQFRHFHHRDNEVVISICNRKFSFTFQNFFIFDRSHIPGQINVFVCYPLVKNVSLKDTPISEEIHL